MSWLSLLLILAAPLTKVLLVAYHQNTKQTFLKLINSSSARCLKSNYNFIYPTWKSQNPTQWQALGITITIMQKLTSSHWWSSLKLSFITSWKFLVVRLKKCVLKPNQEKLTKRQIKYCWKKPLFQSLSLWDFKGCQLKLIDECLHMGSYSSVYTCSENSEYTFPCKLMF